MRLAELLDPIGEQPLGLGARHLEVEKHRAAEPVRILAEIVRIERGVGRIRQAVGVLLERRVVVCPQAVENGDGGFRLPREGDTRVDLVAVFDAEHGVEDAVESGDLGRAVGVHLEGVRDGTRAGERSVGFDPIRKHIRVATADPHESVGSTRCRSCWLSARRAASRRPAGRVRGRKAGSWDRSGGVSRSQSSVRRAPGRWHGSSRRTPRTSGVRRRSHPHAW